MMRKGRAWRYAHVMAFLLWPTISPAALPVSHMTHLATTPLPSPTTTIFFDSPSHCRSLMAPAKTWTSTLRTCSGLSQLQTRRKPPASPDATQ